MSMNALDRYQATAGKYATAHNDLDTLYIGLSAEVGELMSERMMDKRTDRENSEVYNKASELGDILWYVATIAKAEGYDLSHIAHINEVKLIKRKQGEKDDT
jgi:NTP pyrophosphatase (non-canonical NTP hydrolase)